MSGRDENDDAGAEREDAGNEYEHAGGGTGDAGDDTRDASDDTRDAGDDTEEPQEESAVGSAEDSGGDEGQWRFSLEDLPPEGDEEHEGEGIAGAFGPSEEIEPEEIDRESVVFVLLGALVALVGLYLMFP